MGPCHAKSKKTLLNPQQQASSTSIINKIKTGNSLVVDNIQEPTKEPDVNNEPLNRNQLENIDEDSEIKSPTKIEAEAEDDTFELIPLTKKIILKKSGLKALEDKEHRILELMFTYKQIFDFSIEFRLEFELNKYQWELQNLIKNRNNSIIYRVEDKKTGLRANLEIIEYESENDPRIAEIAYQIYLNNIINKTVESVREEEIQIPRKKKKDIEHIEFLRESPILMILDYYIYQEGFQHTLRPRKWLHIVWEDWDSNLKQLIQRRNMEKKTYVTDELTYIGKCILYGLKVLRKAKIVHRNINPKNIFYFNSVKKYKIGNFIQAKLSYTHKLNKNLDFTKIKKEKSKLKEKSSPDNLERESSSRLTKKIEFVSIKYALKTIADRNLIQYNKFDHSVIGTPFYMDPEMKEAFEDNKESVVLYDGLFFSDQYAFAITMFEVEKLNKFKDINVIKDELYGKQLAIYSLKAILLKIIQDKNKQNEVSKVTKTTKPKLQLTRKITTYSPEKSPNKSPEKSFINSQTNSPEMKSPNSVASRFARIRKKKGFLQANQLLNDGLVDRANGFLREYQKNSKGGVGILVEYLRKVQHTVIDESDFLQNDLMEILKKDDPIVRQKIILKFYVEIGDHQKSLQELLYTRETLEKEKTQNVDMNLAEVYFEISRTYMLMGKYGTALSILDDVRSLIQAYETNEIGNSLKKKVYILRMIIYKNKGDLKLALKAAKKLAFFIEKLDISHNTYELALTKEFIAEIYFLLDDNNEAMTNIQMALTYYRDIELTQYTSLQLADALIFASQIYKCILEFENSEAFLTEANVIYSNKYDENHPVIGYISLQMSQLNKDRANYPKAIIYGEKALKIMRLYFQEEDENIIESVKNLSSIYREAEDIRKSIRLLEKSLAIIDKTKMLDDPCPLADNIYNLGLCYMEICDYSNARKQFTEALAIYNSNLVEDDLILNDIMQKITVANYEMTKFSSKNPNQTMNDTKSKLSSENPNQIMNDTKSKFSSKNPNQTMNDIKSSYINYNYEEGNLVNSYINLADILMMNSEFERSLKLYLLALKIKKNSNYNDHKLNDILMKIGLIYLIAGKYDESLKYFQDCLKFISDITSNQMTEHIMRLNLIISHLHVILDQKTQAQEHNEKTNKILTNLRSSSKFQVTDNILFQHAQRFVSIDFSKDRVLDKNEILNDLLEILQVAFHYENVDIDKLDPQQKLSLVSTIHQAQGEIFSRKNIESSTQNLSNEQPPMIKKLNSLMCDSSYRNFGMSLKSPQSFSSSHRGNSLGHSGSTPRFRGDSMIFRKKSYMCLMPGEKNSENTDFFFDKNSNNNLKNLDKDDHLFKMASIKKEKSLTMLLMTPKGIQGNKKFDHHHDLGENKMPELSEAYNESKDDDTQSNDKKPNEHI